MSYLVEREVLSVVQHARKMEEYVGDGIKQAASLCNTGPIRMGTDGALSSEILDSYWKHGFYIFKNVIARL